MASDDEMAWYVFNGDGALPAHPKLLDFEKFNRQVAAKWISVIIQGRETPKPMRVHSMHGLMEVFVVHMLKTIRRYAPSVRITVDHLGGDVVWFRSDSAELTEAILNPSTAVIVTGDIVNGMAPHHALVSGMQLVTGCDIYTHVWIEMNRLLFSGISDEEARTRLSRGRFGVDPHRPVLGDGALLEPEAPGVSE